MSSVLLQAIAVVVLLGGLIFVHELGHFVAAKLLGVKVLRFSIGFGSRLFGFKRGETEYWIATLPLGGYVKMAGDDPRAELAPEDAGRGFLEQPPWKRLLIALAGPGANLLFPGLLIIAILLGQNGKDVPGATVGTVAAGSPAQAAGLLPGDRILSITPRGGAPEPVRHFDDLPDVVSPHAGQPLAFEVERPGAGRLSVTITPIVHEIATPLETVRRGIIGILPSYPEARVAPVAPGSAGPLQPFDLVVAVAGKPVANGVELMKAVAAARCAPLDLEVVRGAGIRLPGAVVRSPERVRLAAVPTCQGEAPSLALTDPNLSTFVGGVDAGTPAAKAGLRRGDAIAAVNGAPVHTWTDLAATQLEVGKPATLTLRDGRTVTLVPELQVVMDELSRRAVSRPSTGFWRDPSSDVPPEALVASMVPRRIGIPEAVSRATDALVGIIRTTVLSIVGLFTRRISTEHIGSFIQLAQFAATAAEQGLSSFLEMMALVSVNLGLMNLLPIPVLDGGHIAQALVESITRRPLTPRAREVANVIGLILIVSLMLFAFKNDIVRMIRPDQG